MAHFNKVLKLLLIHLCVFQFGNGLHVYTETIRLSLLRYKRSIPPETKFSSDNKDIIENKSIGSESSVFATENCTVVVAQIGGTATLPCVVRKFSNGVVSWIRKQDYHLLTVGLTTYNTDERFLVEHMRHLQNWGLLIRDVRPSDEGFYECQISSHPPISIIVELKVRKASAKIQGSPDLYLRQGSLLRLVCNLEQSTEPPVYVFWYHEDRMINYDPGVEIKEGLSYSVLLLRGTDRSHNGNYTCSPSNAAPASINVHVLNATEEKPAAMQHANTTSSAFLPLTRCSLLMVMISSSLLRT